ncbi:type II toxin-antitoxin system antitoxin SocA domain-containing protein [Variovorax atrisoli]|uniref:type II toxin-antitoxin system antitoxin SocA domain-containing protein n=1 Tax=Variovorax atrisoli TaxID=3394203 RepID=UPI0040403518
MLDGWRTLDFDNAVADVSAGNVKTPQGEYKPTGKFAVVDQGKARIAGYVDDVERLCKASLPVVVFGDHTRCLKFVDFPFCMGADGIKVLRPKIAEIDAKYLYHFLRQLHLPDGGYDRHFKYLKREQIPFPSLIEQRRITAILDQAETLRAQRRAAIAQLDSLGQAIFLEMFGDAELNPRGWPVLRLQEMLAIPLRNGVSPSTTGDVVASVLTLAAITGRSFNAAALKESTFASQPPQHQSISEEDFLICRGNGNLHLVGRGQFPTEAMPNVTFPDTMIAARIEHSRIVPTYLQQVWHSAAVRRQIEASARTTNGTFKINQTMLEQTAFPVPPLSLQLNFSARMQAVERLKGFHRVALIRLDELFASLQHRAFRGELTPPTCARRLEDLRILEAAAGLEALIFVSKRMPAGRHHHYKSLKALYFADKRHLEKHGRLIYGETHGALPHGPVPQAAYDATRVLNGERLICDFDDEALRAGLRRIKNDQQDKLVPLRDADFSKLGLAERESLEWAIRYCADMSFEQVKAASHDTAYERTPANAPIPVEYMVDMLSPEARKRHWNL